jgi:hypothetical protein
MKSMIRDLLASQSMAFQGDIVIWRLPDNFTFSRNTPISLKGNRFELLEGESSGHVHCVYADPNIEALENLYQLESPTAEMFFDPESATQLVEDPNLLIGFLVAPVPVLIIHAKNGQLTGEHDPIRVSPGNYYIGRQREFFGFSRMVVD